MTDDSPEVDNTNYGPKAPHWHHFKDIARDGWEFRYLEPGLGCLESAGHRFLINTRLVEDGSRTHRTFTVCYEPESAGPTSDDADERVPFHSSTSDAIARNNILAVRDRVEDGEGCILTVEEDDEERVVEVPSRYLAEKAVDLYTEIRMDTDRDVHARAYTPEEWERKQELDALTEEVNETDV